MMKMVRTKASPVTTWLGGICCVPRALRTIESTTAIFTNEVSMMSMKGASETAPSTRTSEIGLFPPMDVQLLPDVFTLSG
jgi:hypothetical protein